MSNAIARWSASAVAALCLLIAGCALPGTIPLEGTLPHVPAHVTPTPLPPMRFPQDEAPHHDLTEWWYYTGHLAGVDALGVSRAYGFELTVFQTLRGDLPPYYAAHYAVTDLGRGQFHFDDRAEVGSSANVSSSGGAAGFNLSVGGWHMQGLDGSDALSASIPDYVITLGLRALKPVVLHGGTGLLSEGLSGYSYYYSRTRMAITGTMLDHGVNVPVTGLAWMDHQWGNFVPLAGGGWDWFSLQLDDNTDIMLYVLRDIRHQPVGEFGTYVAPDGSYSMIPPSAIVTTALSTWTSPVTGGIYPAGWEVAVASANLQIRLTPLLADQEVVASHSTETAYWEGAVVISGSKGGHAVSGEGYVELTGYAHVPNSPGATAAP